MKIVAFIMCSISVVLFACKNEEKTVKENTIAYVDTVHFFDYEPKIRKEIDSISNNNLAVQMITTDSSKKEKKSTLTPLEMGLFAADFLDKDITQMPIKQFYKESIFTDLTTNSTIMNYTTNKDSLPIKNVDILLNANNSELIKRIDMRLIYAKADTTITENYAWIFGKSFYINTYKEAKGKSTNTSIKIIWGK